MSTQWQFHAFDADLLVKYALGPIQRAVDGSDLALWQTTLAAIEKVFPPCDLGTCALYPNDMPVTALRWWKGHPTLNPTALHRVHPSLFARSAGRSFGQCPHFG
jgi:hypothetical protein